jgi:hypothetical protein
MKTQSAILALLLSGTLATAGDTTAPPAPPASVSAPTPAVQAPGQPAQTKDSPVEEISPILSLAPADAMVVVYSAKPDELLKHPFWTLLEAMEKEPTAEFLDASATAFSGPTMIAVCGAPWNPTSLRVEFATQPAGGADAFFTQLTDAWMPALLAISPGQQAKISPAGDTWTIQLPGPLPITVFAAQKSGLVYGSSRYNDLAAWLGDNDLTHRFVDSDDAKKMLTALPAQADDLVYVNVRGLIPLAAAQADQASPGLSKALRLDRLEFAALASKRVGDDSFLQVTLGLTGAGGGVWDMLAPKNGPLAIASVIPNDYSFFVRGAMVSAADFADRINDALASVDPDIVTEFNQECEEFRVEYGFDPLDDFLGNMVDEWAVALRVDVGGELSVIAATRLASPAVFESHVAALSSHFSLNIETTTVGGTLVRSAPADSRVPIAWTTVGDVLVVSNRPQTLVQVAEGEGLDRNILASSALNRLLPHLPAESAQFAFVNLAPIARMALEELPKEPEAAAVADLLERLSRAESGIGLAVVREEGGLTIRAAGGTQIAQDTGEAAWRSLAASLARARTLSKRLATMSNLRGIVMACKIYANDHKGAWPDHLGRLIESGDVTPAEFRSPFDPSTEEITVANAGRVGSYLYRDGSKLSPEVVVVCERTLREGGACFGYGDGHVEWIEGPRAEELLAVMRSAAQY